MLKSLRVMGGCILLPYYLIMGILIGIYSFLNNLLDESPLGNMLDRWGMSETRRNGCLSVILSVAIIIILFEIAVSHLGIISIIAIVILIFLIGPLIGWGIVRGAMEFITGD